MAFSRYSRTPLIAMGHQFGTQQSMRALYTAVKMGMIATEKVVIKKAERLDILAGRRYGDAKLWWVIAAASGIGWGLQIPPGVVLTVPLNIAQVEAIVA